MRARSKAPPGSNSSLETSARFRLDRSPSALFHIVCSQTTGARGQECVISTLNYPQGSLKIDLSVTSIFHLASTTRSLRLRGSSPGHLSSPQLTVEPTAIKTAPKRFWPLLIREANSSKLFIILVPGGGVEPPRGCPRRILSPLRLPVPPSRLVAPVSAKLVSHSCRTASNRDTAPFLAAHRTNSVSDHDHGAVGRGICRSPCSLSSRCK